MPPAGPRYGVLMADDEDWRLEAELDSEQQTGVLDRILGAARGGDGQAAEDVRAALGNEVVVTHDGRRLFAYAPSEVVLQDARAKIEQVLQRDGLQARIRASHWDEDMDEWVQTDPPLSGEAARSEQAAARDTRRIETRTIACGSGKIVRASLERTMLARAQELGLECKVVEHPHLLTTQLLFTLTGPHGRIEEFRRELKAEAWATIRADGWGTGLA